MQAGKEVCVGVLAAVGGYAVADDLTLPLHLERGPVDPRLFYGGLALATVEEAARCLKLLGGTRVKLINDLLQVLPCDDLVRYRIVNRHVVLFEYGRGSDFALGF